jgi:hypothetical protein
MSYDYTTGLGVPGVGTLTGGVIASGQAFWIKANAGASNPTLVVHESAKTSSSGEFYRKAPKQNNGLSITLSDYIGKDVSWLLVNPDAKNGYDSKYDRSKLEAPALSISFLVENRKLTNSTIREIDNTPIPLFVFSGNEGEYSISFEEVGSFTEFNDLVLVDKRLGNFHKISSGPYLFPNSGSVQMPDRFYLTKKTDLQPSNDAILSVYPNPAVDKVTVKVFSTEETTAAIKDINGVALLDGKLEPSTYGSQSKTFDIIDLPKGIYLIQTRVGLKLISRKIIKD